MNRFNVRLPEPSLGLVVLSFEPGLFEKIAEPELIVNGECGRRQPFDHCGFFIGSFVDEDFVPDNTAGT